MSLVDPGNNFSQSCTWFYHPISKSHEKMERGSGNQGRYVSPQPDLFLMDIGFDVSPDSQPKKNSEVM